MTNKTFLNRFIDTLSNEGVEFFCRAYGISGQAKEKMDKIDVLNYATRIYKMGADPDTTSFEEFLTVTLGLYYNGDMTNIANFLAKAFHMPAAISAEIFLLADDLDTRNAIMLESVYQFYLAVMEEEDTDDNKIAMTAVGVVKTFCKGEM